MCIRDSSYRSAGENIAKNANVEKAHVALMNSAGHKANIDVYKRQASVLVMHTPIISASAAILV